MLLAEFPAYRLALIVYWLNILFLGTTLYFSWMCATDKGLVKHDLSPEVPAAIRRRIIDWANAVCVWRDAMRFQHLLEHRVYRAGAAKLCHRAPDSGACADVRVSRVFCDSD